MDENALFICEYALTKKVLIRQAYDRFYRGMGGVIKIVTTVLGVILLAGSLQSISGNPTELDWIYFALGVFGVYRGLIQPAVHALKMHRQIYHGRNEKLVSMRIEFLIENITTSQNNIHADWHYDDIQGIEEKKDAIVILLKEKRAIRFYTDSFTKGTWPECKQFIEEKRREMVANGCAGSGGQSLF